MSNHKYNHDLAQRDDFVVRFSCEADWARFADERSDPELASAVREAVRKELKRRRDAEPSPVTVTVAAAPVAPAQPEPDDDANAVEFSEPTEGSTPQ